MAAILDVVVHPVAGTVRAVRRWPVRVCRVRALLALIVLGLGSTLGTMLYLRVVSFRSPLLTDDLSVLYVLPILIGCEVAAAIVLLGGTLVRMVAAREWARSVDEKQYVRLMAASMWALAPFALGSLLAGGIVGRLIEQPLIVLGVLPIGMGVSYALLVRSVVRRLDRSGTGEPTCDCCGYLLRGLQDPRCPECGEPFPAEWLAASGSTLPPALIAPREALP